jgi:hypothetical protein
LAHQGTKVYYFESAILPALLWADLNKVEFSAGTDARIIPIRVDTPLGNVTANFKPAEPFMWLGVK